MKQNRELCVGQVIKETKHVSACSSMCNNCGNCGEREIYIYITILEILENVVCVRRSGQIEWMTKGHLVDLLEDEKEGN